MIPYAYLLVIAIPILAAALMAPVSLLGRGFRHGLALLAGLATAVCAISLYGDLQAGTVYSTPWLSGSLRFSVGTDALSVFMAMIAGVLGFLIIAYSVKYMELDTDHGLARYFSLVLLFVGAMIGLVLTTNLLVLYFFWEITGVCSYALIGFDYRNPKAANAGIKAFMITRIGDVGLFSGIMVLYFSANPHTFDLPTLINAAGAGTIPSGSLAFAAFAVFLGAVGKSAQVPLHVWLPDAMEAPTPISALIHAATMVNAGVYLTTRVYPIFQAVPHWAQTVMWIGVITAGLAGLAAVVQSDLKRLLAYSTISQLGLMMFAIGTGGIVAAQFHLLSHAIFKALLFLCAGSVIHAVGSRDINKMGGLGKKMPITAVCFLVGACALSGIPFFNGFWSKDMIFASAYESGNYAPFILAVIAAGLTVAYAFKAFAAVFLGKPQQTAHDEAHGHAGEAPVGMWLPVALLAFGALVSWLLIGIFSRAYVETGLAATHLSLREMIKETLALKPALAGSVCALCLGFLAFAGRRAIASFARRFCRPAVACIRGGFGFDTLYYWIRDRIIGAGKFLCNGFDDQVADGFDRIIVTGFRGLSGALSRSHTGDLGLDVLGIMVGLGLLILVIFVVG